MRRLTKQQWQKKVEAALKEARDCALARFTEREDERPIYLDETNDDVLSALDTGRTGVYHLLDSDGKVLAECAVGRSGERENPRSFDQGRHQSQFIGAFAEGWERQATALSKDNERLRGEIADLKKENTAYRDMNDALKDQLRDATLESGEDDPMLEFFKEGLDFIKGQGLQKELIKRINDRGILDRLSPEAQQEVLGLLQSGALS